MLACIRFAQATMTSGLILHRCTTKHSCTSASATVVAEGPVPRVTGRQALRPEGAGRGPSRRGGLPARMCWVPADHRPMRDSMGGDILARRSRARAMWQRSAAFWAGLACQRRLTSRGPAEVPEAAGRPRRNGWGGRPPRRVAGLAISLAQHRDLISPRRGRVIGA